MVAQLKVSKIAQASRACTTSQAKACFTVTCPDGIGRDRVRATCASNSLSVMSFQVHPAPRIKKAPMAQPRMIQRSNSLNEVDAAASNTPHQQGNNSSHVPMGRSARLSRR